jgi:pimeloyl-ACP methyl ester carboxylesterase
MQELTAIGDGEVKLAVQVHEGPPGAPGLLLMHGLASSRHIWDLMLPRLTRTFRVVTYDARGHGRSAKPASGFGFDHVVADARAVLRATRLHRPVVAGHSWGAMVALELAAAHPRALAGAVLVDGGVTSMRPAMDWAQVKRELAPPRLAGMPATQFRAMIGTFFADAVDVTPDVADIVMSVMRIRPDGAIAPYLSRANHFRILRAIWEQDVVACYRRLRVPTLAILVRTPGEDGGKRDAAATVRAAAAGRPLTITWTEGIHDVPLQHPAALAGRIERFSAGVVG